MTDFNTGDYAANTAGIMDAWNKAKAAISAQRQSTLQNYGYGANGQLDPTNKYGQYQQIEHNYALSQPDQQHNQDAYNAQYGTNVGRENEDYAAQLARGQKQSGFNFKDGGLQLDPNDPNGAYQQMLGGQTRQLTSLEDAQVSRGLGHGGLANRAVDQAEGDASSNRSNYRDQLLNQFMDNQKGHTRTIADFATQKKEADYGFQNQKNDAAYQHGLAQNNLGIGMADAMSGFDQQGLALDSQFGADNNNAMLQAILAALGQDNGTGTATGGATGNKTSIAQILNAGRAQRLGF